MKIQYLGTETYEGMPAMFCNCAVCKRAMQQEGLIGEKTIVVISHFFHNVGQTYDEMCPEIQKDGVIVAYDGLGVVF